MEDDNNKIIQWLQSLQNVVVLITQIQITKNLHAERLLQCWRPSPYLVSHDYRHFLILIVSLLICDCEGVLA